MNHDPLYYARFHRYSLVLVNWFYIIGLISTHWYPDTHQMSMHAFMYWIFAWISIESISMVYRYNFMYGPFRDWRVALKIAYTTNIEEAIDIARNVSVWPSVKTVKYHSQWAKDIREKWINAISVMITLMVISILVATV